MTCWEPVIGLEVHIQLATKSKLFCGCAAAFGARPNSQICEVCAGHPGGMPTLNGRAVELAMRLASALGCVIQTTSRFARKSYSYPDLPKGYQITQYDQPLAQGGALGFELRVGRAADAFEERRVNLTRLHLEEDAGKTLYETGSGGETLIDLNRAGVPLVELVSEPELRSPDEAAAYLRALRTQVRWLGVSDGNLDQGSLRCDANISLRPAGSTALGPRTELKNLNSFRHVKQALAAEIARQRASLDAGEVVEQQTRSWDPRAGETRLLRAKEEAEDYRYLTEPDLPPLMVDARGADARSLELPLARQRRLVSEHRAAGLSSQLARELCREIELADAFEQLVQRGVTARRAATWILGELLSHLDDPRQALKPRVSLDQTAELLRLVEAGQLTLGQAKDLWAKLWTNDDARAQAVEMAARSAGLLDAHIERAELERAVERFIADHPDEVAAYRAGKQKLLGWFIGQLQRELGGRADPRALQTLLTERLRG
ncbi:MAG: Asp-tRNA(Asn)/Glu-tRNA(Gln) amidotransferase GatCAB subunit B [Proteobacteria bacterium]|nr:MAG: Asp-tRNA(Asn)/Glu-tRNA(Gln) amidotransferase GatCAB subunit B [Pseudomonadota bacterium]